MKHIKYEDILTNDNIETLKRTITRHGVIIYPTDTLYGMGGNFFSLPTIEKIDALKKRNDMPYSVIVPGLDMLQNLEVMAILDAALQSTGSGKLETVDNWAWQIG